MQHADAVIARRRRGVEQAPTKEEAERRERSLQRFIEQVTRDGMPFAIASGDRRPTPPFYKPEPNPSDPLAASS